jgi:hypothetical protein
MSSLIAQRFDNHGKRCRLLAAAWVVEMIAREWLAPVIQNANKIARRYEGLKIIERQIGKTVACPASRYQFLS